MWKTIAEKVLYTKQYSEGYYLKDGKRYRKYKKINRLKFLTSERGGDLIFRLFLLLTLLAVAAIVISEMRNPHRGHHMIEGTSEDE